MAKVKNNNVSKVKKTSLGQHPSVSAETRKAVRRAYVESGMRLLNQLDAHLKGKNTTPEVSWMPRSKDRHPTLYTGKS